VLTHLSGRIGVDIEIKNIPGEPDFDPDGGPLVAAIATALEGFIGPALLSCFNPFSLIEARKVAPSIPLGLLAIDEVEPDAVLSFALENGFEWVLPGKGALTRAGSAFVERAHGSGVRVGTWVVDDPQEAVRFVEMGVDAVATNDPTTIVAAREAT
jgi:glycerophosphoryl diester phosphodiesterase